MPKNAESNFHLGGVRNDVSLLSMSNSADALRRWLGLFCLAVAAAMLTWGQIVLKPVLDGVWYLIYWLICFLFTIAAIGIALLDVRAVRRRTREEQTELIRKTLEKIEAEPKEKKDEKRDE